MQTVPTLENTITQLFSCVDSMLIEYCILRNFEGLPKSTGGGDIDLVLRERDVFKWSEALYEVAQNNSLHVGLIQSHYHGKRYCLFGFPEKIFLKLDVHFGEFWRGVEYSSCEELLKDRVKYKEFYVPSVVNRSMVCLLDPLLTGGAPRDKYKDSIIKCAFDERDLFLEKLSSIIGVKQATVLTKLLGEDRYLDLSRKASLVRVNLWFRKVFTRARTSTRFWGYVKYEVRRRMRPLGTVVQVEGDDAEVKQFLISFQEFLDVRFFGMTAKLIWPKTCLEKREINRLTASITNYNIVLGPRETFSGIALKGYFFLTGVRVVRFQLTELKKNSDEFSSVGFSEAIESVFQEVVLQYKTTNNI